MVSALEGFHSRYSTNSPMFVRINVPACNHYLCSHPGLRQYTAGFSLPSSSSSRRRRQTSSQNITIAMVTHFSFLHFRLRLHALLHTQWTRREHSDMICNKLKFKNFFLKWRYNMSSILQFIEQLRGTTLGSTGVIIYDAMQQRYESALTLVLFMMPCNRGMNQCWHWCYYLWCHATEVWISVNTGVIYDAMQQRYESVLTLVLLFMMPCNRGMNQCWHWCYYLWCHATEVWISVNTGVIYDAMQQRYESVLTLVLLFMMPCNRGMNQC